MASEVHTCPTIAKGIVDATPTLHEISATEEKPGLEEQQQQQGGKRLIGKGW